jgi:hypothetical protein
MPLIGELLRLLDCLQHPQYQVRNLIILIRGQRVPVPFAFPNAPRGVCNSPAFLLKLRKDILHVRSGLLVASAPAAIASSEAAAASVTLNDTSDRVAPLLTSEILLCSPGPTRSYGPETAKFG